jgi:hypothetical protein
VCDCLLPMNEDFLIDSDDISHYTFLCLPPPPPFATTLGSHVFFIFNIFLFNTLCHLVSVVIVKLSPHYLFQFLIFIGGNRSKPRYSFYWKQLENKQEMKASRFMKWNNYIN